MKTGAERKGTVLVVDDDADARLVMRAALRKAGHDVLLADTGQAALAQFDADTCDMVMLDVDMPDVSGFEVCAALRARAGPLLPIVMVTGLDDLASVEAAYEAGATDFIAKPVNWALLGHRVRYLFRSRQAMLALRAAEARNAAILNAIPDLLFEVDIEGRYIDYRAPQAQLLVDSGRSLIGRTVSEVLPPAAAQVCMAALHSALLHGAASGGQFELPLPQGNAWFELSVSRKAVAAGDKPRFIVLSRDITERKVAEARIARLAFFDSLTGLPNRRSFLSRVERAIRRASVDQTKLAVLFMDLDGFKTINDTMGHAAGDRLLQMAAARLADGLRPADLLSRPMSFDGLDTGEQVEAALARLGGDEFTALVLDIQCVQDALSVAQRIGALMRQPFVLDGRDITLTTSIGIALFPDNGADGPALLKHADTAMYHAKKSGRDKAEVYCASLTTNLQQRLDLDADLRLALSRGEFHLLYQPQISLATGRIHSVEALIRWQHPVRGVVSPLDFIPLAEENGLIVQIGHWVLSTATAQAAAWQRAGLALRVAVNLSPRQFRAPALAHSVMEVLAACNLPPHLLELEVTEGALMDHTSATRAALQALREHGVHIALDDFGTGYSSLAYLTRMPISHIKVDRCFVNGLLDGGESAAIVRAVLAMAHSLGLDVTAEGVETLAQAKALQAMGCEHLQGFYFSRPVAAHDVPPLLRQQWQLDAPDAPGDSAVQLGVAAKQALLVEG